MQDVAEGACQTALPAVHPAGPAQGASTSVWQPLQRQKCVRRGQGRGRAGRRLLTRGRRGAGHAIALQDALHHLRGAKPEVLLDKSMPVFTEIHKVPIQMYAGCAPPPAGGIFQGKILRVHKEPNQDKLRHLRGTNAGAARHRYQQGMPSIGRPGGCAPKSLHLGPTPGPLTASGLCGNTVSKTGLDCAFASRLACFGSVRLMQLMDMRAGGGDSAPAAPASAAAAPPPSPPLQPAAGPAAPRQHCRTTAWAVRDLPAGGQQRANRNGGPANEMARRLQALAIEQRMGTALAARADKPSSSRKLTSLPQLFTHSIPPVPGRPLR